MNPCNLLPFGVALLALIVCIDQLAQPHVLLGIDEYDDGVYLGAALRLAHRVAPYQDFAFPHPPGLSYLLLPIAIAAKWTGSRAYIGEARVLTALVAATNVFLLARLVRHRGTHAVLIAGLTLAVFPLAATADKTVLLEPYLVLFCLLGATALFKHNELAFGERIVWAGLAFGFAGSIKVWAILPVAAAIACCASHLRKQLAPLLTGVTLGFVLPSLPFFLLTPSKFVDDVIVVQLTRSASSGAFSTGQRLEYLTGISGLPSVHPTVGLATVIAVGYLLIVAVAFIMRPRPTRLDWFALATAGLTASAVLVAPDFFLHYSYFTAAFLGLLLAVSCDRLVRTLSGRNAPRSGSAGRAIGGHAPAVLIVLVVLASAFAFVEGRRYIRDVPGILNVGDPGSAIARVIPSGACVVTDQPAFAITANRFVPDSSGCPPIVDSYYTWVVADPAKPPPSAGPYDPSLISAWRSWFAGAEYVILSPEPFRIPWTSELRSWFASHFELVSSSGASVYRRVG